MSLQIEDEEMQPVCGKDFCDLCGDCLACYWESACPYSGNGHHVWVIAE